MNASPQMIWPIALVSLALLPPAWSTPTLVSAAADCAGGKVQVEFSESMDWETVQDPANYVLDGGISVEGVTPVGDNLRYWLTVSGALAQGQTYTVTVNNLAGSLGDPIAPNSQAQFQCDPEAPVMSIGNLVFRDLDNDGLYEPLGNDGQSGGGDDETGIDGVVLNLHRDWSGNGSVNDESAPALASTTTAGGGRYIFAGLSRTGSQGYIVEVARSNFLPGGALAGLVSSDGGNSWTPAAVDSDDNGFPGGAPYGIEGGSVWLTIGQNPVGDDGDPNTDFCIDFGFRLARSLTLGNRVFRDENNNGRRDAGEAGVDGVVMNLFRDDDRNCGLGPEDAALATTATGPDGTFEFTDLAPTPGGPEYILEVARSNFLPGAPLANLVSSDANEYPFNYVDDDDNGYPVGAPFGVVVTCLRIDYGVMPTAEDGDPNTDLTMDFGFRPARPLTLGNLVFQDLDNNGLRGPGESGVQGVVVHLYRDDGDCGLDDGDVLLTSTSTDASGRFEFTDLAPTSPGAEYILEVAAGNFAPGGVLDGWMTSSAAEYLYNGVDDDDNGFQAGGGFGVVITCVRADFGRMPTDEDGDPNTDLTMDFGFTRAFRVGNLVWADLNDNGLRDPGEPGIPGVEVGIYRDNGDGLLGDGDAFVRNTVTDTAGQYEFRELASGGYFVAIPPWLHDPGRVLSNRASSTGNDPAPGPDSDVDDDDNGSVADPSAGASWSGFVVSGLLTLRADGEPVSEDGDPNTNLAVDFGFRQGPLPSLGNLVWNDLNDDGVRDAGEPGLGGVGVSLYVENGGGLMWTTTGPDGLYQFTGVPPGRYLIRIEYGSFAPGQPLYGFVSSTGVAEPDADPDDQDDNGQDTEYPLHRAVHSPVFTVSAGGAPTHDGDDDQGNQTIDFGFHAPADGPALTLGNRVWRDDGDGVQEDGESGVGNVGLQLFRDLGEPGRDGADEHVAGTSTDADGNSRFAGLPPGDYLVEVGAWNFNFGGVLLGLMSSPGAADPDNDLAADDNGVDSPMPVNWGVRSEPITLSAGGEPTGDGDDADGNLTLGFGFWSPAEPPVLVLGGSVWRDLNANGRREEGEPGLAQVGLSIIEVLPDNAEVHQGGGSTDADGNYRFWGRPAGRYYVRIDNWNFNPGAGLAGLVSSPGAADANADGQADDNGLDMPVPRIWGLRTHAVQLQNNAEPTNDGDDANGNLTVDFGMVPAMTLGDQVFLDANGDGVFNGGDAGVDNVTLHLFQDRNLNDLLDGEDWHLASVSTAAGGRYAFTDLAPGDYLVLVGSENFRPGGALFDTATSPADESDPDLDEDHNDNGLVRHPHGVISGSMALSSGGEPTDDGDGAEGNLTLDFGFQAARGLTLGNLVFRDWNNNGRYEPALGETGVAGVVVELRRDHDASNSASEGDPLVGTTVTDADGRFELTGLEPTAGTVPYVLSIPAVNWQTGGPLDGWITSESTFGQGHEGWSDGYDHGWLAGAEQGVSTWQLQLEPGQLPITEDGDANTDVTIDFGFTPEMRLGNIVWADLNENGVRDPGEPGISGVEVQVWTDNGDGVFGEGDVHRQGVGTDYGGRYEFRGLPFGNYFVVIPPWNHDPGRALVNRTTSPGNDPAPDPVNDVDDDDNGRLVHGSGGDEVVSGLIQLTVGGEPADDGDNANGNQTLDFGFAQGPLPSIGNLVWHDLNDNGVRDAGEPGLGGVAITLFSDGGDGLPNAGADTQLVGTITGPDGTYQFTAVQPGNYYLRLEYWNFLPGYPLFGFVSSTGVVDPNGAPTPADAVDDDDNGIDERFPVRQSLYSPVFAVAAGGGPTSDGDDDRGNQTIDFGFHAPANGPVLSLGDRVWRDDGSDGGIAGDGIRQPGEPGIPNVGIGIIWAGEDGLKGTGDDWHLGHAWTDGAGLYQVPALPPGRYWLSVDNWNFYGNGALRGLMSSPGAGDANAPAGGDEDDNGLDAAVPVSSGVPSDVVELTMGGEPTDDGDDANGNRALDFGFHASPQAPVLSVGGTVWLDANGNGGREGDEPGIAAVGVTLFRRQPDGSDLWIYGTGTDEHGDYRFDGLPAGSYRVIVWNWNFNPGGPLASRFSSPGAADPDADVKGDDNGADASQPAQSNVYSRWITLSHGSEPATDGDGADGNQTLDFGFFELPGGPNLSVGGVVFADQANDGWLNDADAGVDNVYVELWIDNGDGAFGAGDSIVASAYASAGGRYRFDGLPPADYLPVVTRWNLLHGPLVGYAAAGGPMPVPDPDTDVAGDNNGADVGGFGHVYYGVASAPVSLRLAGEPTAEDGDDQTNLTVDFGFVPGAAMRLGGTVFRDEDNNGVRDAGTDTGIAGVAVELWLDHNRDGVPSDGDGWVTQTPTAADGTWSFLVAPGDDYLVVIRYANFQPGRALNGLSSSLGSQAAPDPDDDTDNDDNGAPLAGFGKPFFAVASLPLTMAPGGEPTGDGDADPNTNFTLDFGFHAGPTASLGDLVFLDANNSGARESGEPGIANVHVKLFYDSNADGRFGEGDEDLGVDVLTDVNGNYTLSGLPPGDYLVVLPHDNGWPGRALNGLRSSTGNGLEAPDPEVNPADDDDNGEERRVSFWPSVQVGTKALDVREGSDFSRHVDFGFTPGTTLQVGGTLFRDADNNGRFEPEAGEEGIPNTAVELVLDNNLDGVLGPGDQSIGQTRSDPQGGYRFSGLWPGDYLIWISRWEHFYGQGLTGLRASTPAAADPDTDEDNDNNAVAYFDPGSGWWTADATGVITLDWGAEPDSAVDGDGPDSNLTVDLGFHAVTGTTLIVTTADDHDDGLCDAGDCTLREAIHAANANPGADTILFDIGAGGLQTITPATPLPEVIEPVLLDATTQPGYTGLPLVELSGGGGGGGGAAGLVLRGGHSTVRGLVINRFEFGGLHLIGGAHNIIQGNFIGTDPSGTAATGGTTSEHGGILLESSDDNQIGGATASARNLVSGGNVGIRCSNSRRNVIEGNYVGTDRTGTLAVGNDGRAGIWVTGGGQNRVGGTESGSGNLISGNNGAVDPWAGAGLILEWSPGTVVQGNHIGTDATGTLALGNQMGLTTSGPGLTIGGVEAGSRNLISGNRSHGANLGGECQFMGNLVGLDVTGATPLGNAGVGVGLWGTANVLGGATPAERNVISGNRDDGVVICGSPGRGDHVIQGNYIGTDLTGMVALGNGAGGWGPGIRTCGDNNFNTIGGPAPGAGNLIAGNHGSQVDLRSSDNVVQGNRIGTDVAGTSGLLPASGGVGVFETAERNLISGNLISGVSQGIYLAGPGVRGTRIVGNQVGTTADGVASLPNNVGVDVNESSANQIGGIAAGEGNTIRYNAAYGIAVAGTSALNNTIRGNSIHHNGNAPGDWLGIDLSSGTVVTPNDPGDADEGPNRVQNFPVLLQAAASAGALAIEGRLNSAPGTVFLVDFYANAQCDPTGYGEGERHLGWLPVTTDAGGDAVFQVNLPVSVAAGQFLTATATDPAGNTSEFSRCEPVVADGPPAVLGAATRGRPAYVEITFSESLDATTALDPGNYALDCGVGVVGAAFGADARTVVLTLDGTLVPGCRLTMNNLRDRAEPPYTLAAGTQAIVLDSQGVLLRRVFRDIGGSLVGDLTGSPKFPNAPDEVAYDTAFEAPANHADSFGAQMAGYILPPVTGDYVFYLASDDASELYLSTDADPTNKARIAWVSTWMDWRAWNSGLRWTPPEQVFGSQTLFIEAEDFNHGGGQWVAGPDTGMNGPYSGAAYAGLSAVPEIDYHDPAGDNPAGNDNANPEYRAADQGVEIASYAGPNDRTRGDFEVTVAYKIGWASTGDWYNYTRTFPEPAREYAVYGRLASGGSPIGARLDEVTSGASTTDQSTSLLGFFQGRPTGLQEAGGWNTFALIPLTDADGAAVTVTLGGTRTLRSTVTATGDFDYLALVPTLGSPPPEVRPENVSASVHLVAGQKYYIEALMKDGSGGDHLAVTWQMPGAPPPANGDPPIPGAFLSSLSSSGPVAVADEPQDQTAEERTSATFTLALDGTPPYSIQWYRNAVALPGQNGTSLTLPSVSGADHGAQFHATVANAFSSAETRRAVLTVIPDTELPAVVRVSGTPGLDAVEVRFSEPLAVSSANDAAHYALSGNLGVLSATLLPDQHTVRLGTTPQAMGVRYSLVVNGVLDLAFVPNAIAPDTKVSFTAWTLARGFVLHELWDNINGGVETLRQDPRYAANLPTVAESLTAVEWPPDGGNEGGSNYGNRLSGWVVPPVTGDYRFSVCSDDPSEVYLSTDDQPANKALICFEPSWNNPRDYRTLDRRNPVAPENISAPRFLEANRRYYIEVLHTEGGGGDNVSLAWQLPGGAEVQSFDPPLNGQFVESMVDPDAWAPALAALSPAAAPAGSGETAVGVLGDRFTPDSVVLWNGASRPTAFVDARHLTVTIPPDDLGIATELTTALIRVRGAGGLVSDPLPFTITGALVQEAQSDIAASGARAETASLPAAQDQPGVSASIENTGSPEPIAITTATYTDNPTPTAPAFDVGGEGDYVDLMVQGADPGDAATARFYYPAAIAGEAEADLALLYFDGARWVLVLSSGGLPPLKDTADNLDGTLSGGRFTVTFDATSTPSITELHGTPFLLVLPESSPPEAVGDLVVRRPGLGVKIPIPWLLGNDTDPEHDPLALIGFSPVTSAGGVVTQTGSWLVYALPAGFDGNDSFTYTITDGQGGLASASVRIEVQLDAEAGRNTLSAAVADGKTTLRFAGIPGRTYRVQSSSALSPPGWTDVGSPVVCGPDGLMTFVDPEVHEPMRFYRTVTP